MVVAEEVFGGRNNSEWEKIGDAGIHCTCYYGK